MSAINNDNGFQLEVDTVDKKLELDFIGDKATKESFIWLIFSAWKGEDLLPIIELLWNSSQQYGHSLTMNAVMKMISLHSHFKDHSTSFYTMKREMGVEKLVLSKNNSLTKSNKVISKRYYSRNHAGERSLGWITNDCALMWLSF